MNLFHHITGKGKNKIIVYKKTKNSNAMKEKKNIVVYQPASSNVHVAYKQQQAAANDIKMNKNIRKKRKRLIFFYTFLAYFFPSIHYSDYNNSRNKMMNNNNSSNKKNISSSTILATSLKCILFLYVVVNVFLFLPPCPVYFFLEFSLFFIPLYLNI